MTQREVRGSQEGAGHLRSTPLPVSAVKMDIAEILANNDGAILCRELHLVDDITRAKLTLRHPEI